MRPIKFRAWDKNGKVMSYEVDLYFDMDWTAQVRFENGDKNYFFNQETGELMQFTGLTDKNGKEIWENDIVLTGWEGFRNKAWYVGWEQGGFVLINNMGRPFAFGSDDFVDEDGDKTIFEVIGNIYENPELLK